MPDLNIYPKTSETQHFSSSSEENNKQKKLKLFSKTETPKTVENIDFDPLSTSLKNGREIDFTAHKTPIVDTVQPLIFQQNSNKVSNVPYGGCTAPFTTFETSRVVQTTQIANPDCFEKYFSKPNPKVADFDLIVGFDTEYYQKPLLDDQTEKDAENVVLSYQVAAIYQQGDEFTKTRTYAERIIEPYSTDRLKRHSLGEILANVFNMHGIGRRKADGMKILLVAHFGRAEWSVLADRKELITSGQMKPVRDVPISFKPFVINVPFPNEHFPEVSVMWRDTYLLAPGGFQSLSAISSLTACKKVELPEGTIEAMHEFKRDHREEFDFYGISDARVTLEYFLMTTSKMYSLSGVDTIPMTLGGFSIDWYAKWLEENKSDHLSYDKVFGKELIDCINKHGKPIKVKRNTPFRQFTETKAGHCFYGGLNTAFFIGDYACKPNEIILDVDFSGAYTAAMATLPMIDFFKPKTFFVTKDNDKPYNKSNPCIYLRPTDLDEYDGQINVQLVFCKFKFPEGTKNPCLPVKTEYGLIYPNEGFTTCTGIEVNLAIQFGADVWILDGDIFQNVLDNDYNSIFPFAPFLSYLATERQKHKKNTIENLMYKEAGNSFYGKSAQGIQDRNIRNFTGEDETQRLGPSKITCPHYAAMTTGIVRAALSSLIDCVANFPGCRVLSATTDGAMIVVPFKGDIKATEKGDPIIPQINEIIPDLFEKLMSFDAIKILETGRRRLNSGNFTWLEIKHLGNFATTYKTRGYILEFNNRTQHIAKAGHKFSTRKAKCSRDEETKRLRDLYASEQIFVMDVESLASFGSIFDGVYKDLVGVSIKRSSNLDFDYKRIPINDHETRAPSNDIEVRKYRQAVANIRKRGHRATRENVEMNQAGISLRGDSAAAIKRMLLRAIAQNRAGLRQIKIKDKTTFKDMEIAELLEVSDQDYKNAKTRSYKAIPDSVVFRKVASEFLAKIGKKLTPELIETLTGGDFKAPTKLKTKGR